MKKSRRLYTKSKHSRRRRPVRAFERLRPVGGVIRFVGVYIEDPGML